MEEPIYNKVSLLERAIQLMDERGYNQPDAVDSQINNAIECLADATEEMIHMVATGQMPTERFPYNTAEHIKVERDERHK